MGKARALNLLKWFRKIRELLEVRLVNKKLRPIDAYDIIMHSSDAVLSGGTEVRR